MNNLQVILLEESPSKKKHSTSIVIFFGKIKKGRQNVLLPKENSSENTLFSTLTRMWPSPRVTLELLQPMCRGMNLAVDLVFAGQPDWMTSQRTHRDSTNFRDFLLVERPHSHHDPNIIICGSFRHLEKSVESKKRGHEEFQVISSRPFWISNIMVLFLLSLSVLALSCLFFFVFANFGGARNGGKGAVWKKWCIFPHEEKGSSEEWRREIEMNP